MMVHIPGQTKAGSTSDEPVISHDIFPSLVDILGLEVKGKASFDGHSIRPVLTEKKIVRDALVWHYPHYHGSTWKPGAAIRQGKWKLVKHFETETSELYDLSTDIGEQQDLSATEVDKKQALENLLMEKLRNMEAQFPTINSNYKE